MNIKVDLSKYTESNTITTRSGYQFIVGDIELDFNEIGQLNDCNQILTKNKVSLILNDTVIFEDYIVVKVYFAIIGIFTTTAIDVIHDIDKTSLFYMINHNYYKNDIETFSKIGKCFLKHGILIHRDISDELAETLIDIEQAIVKTLDVNNIDVKLINYSKDMK